jgi:hypothetical protein
MQSLFILPMSADGGIPVAFRCTDGNTSDSRTYSRSGEVLGLRSTVSYFTRLVAPGVFGYIAALATLSVVFWINAAMLGQGAP